MEVKVPYGQEYVSVTINDKNLVGVYKPNDVKKTDYAKEIEETLNAH